MVHIHLYLNFLFLQSFLPYWLGLEYVNYIPCWEVRSSPKSSVLGMTLNCIWWWGSSSGGLSLLPDQLWPRVVILVRIPSIGEIDLFKEYLYSIGSYAKKEKKKLSRNFFYRKNVNLNLQWMQSRHKIILDRLKSINQSLN